LWIIANRRASRANPAGNRVRVASITVWSVRAPSTPNDGQIGNIIAEAAKKVGKVGVITVAACNRGTT